MRHGNKYPIPLPVKSVLHSDPTYEAWKPYRYFHMVVGDPDSDPTYEAWKPSQSLHIGRYSLNSDPTYEAWKLESVLCGYYTADIPILPMRHGNRTTL